jgi:hypothetical protein
MYFTKKREQNSWNIIITQRTTFFGIWRGYLLEWGWLAYQSFWESMGHPDFSRSTNMKTSEWCL